MKRNVNFMLLLLVLASMLSMTVMAWYYKRTYDDLNGRYASARADILAAAEELNRTISEVEAKEELLNRKEVILTDYINELNLSKERETSLGSHFTDMRNDNIYLGEKLNKTVLDRDKWQSLYNVTQRNYGVCIVDLQGKTVELQESLGEINRIQGLKPSLDASAGKLEEREGDVSTNVGKIDDLAREIGDMADDVDNATLSSEIKSNANEIKSKVDAIGDILDRMAQDLAEINYLISKI